MKQTKKNINELIIDTIKHGCGKLISDLNFEKWIIIEEIELKKNKNTRNYWDSEKISFYKCSLWHTIKINNITFILIEKPDSGLSYIIRSFI